MSLSPSARTPQGRELYTHFRERRAGPKRSLAGIDGLERRQRRRPRLLFPKGAEVQDEIRDVRLQRQGEPRRRRHVADLLRVEEIDHPCWLLIPTRSGWAFDVLGSAHPGPTQDDSSDDLGRARARFAWHAHDPMLQVTPFDLDGSLELHVLELAAIASAVHDGLPHLQQRADLGPRE
jgi:hypothetical protein